LVGTAIIALIIWVFLPDDNRGWRPYTFDEELVAMEAKRIIPAEENAATIYNQLLENYDSNSFNKNFLSWKLKNSILYEFWAGKDYPEVASWLKDNQTLINQLMQACEKDKCRFSIAANLDEQALKPPKDFMAVRDFWWSLQSKRLSPMRHWGELLICSANNDVAEGCIDQALKKYTATLQIAKHLYQQPTPLDLLVGIAINLHGLEQINKYVVTFDATHEQLLLLDGAVQNIKYNWQSDLIKILEREKLMFKSFMCGMFYQTNPEGNVRLNRDPNSALSAQIHIPKASNYWRQKFTKAKTIFCWSFVPSTPQKAAMIIDDVHKQYYAMAKPDFDWEIEPKQFSLRTSRPNFCWLMEIMSRILENNWPTIHDRYLQATAWKRASRLIIALRRYKNQNGVWPKSLDDIKNLTAAENFLDPINNGSFVYKRTDKNFTLYSKGENNVDEGGIHDSKEFIDLRGGGGGETDVKKDDWQIWPRSPKNKKVNKDEQ
jgi:hypothetical protein